MQPTVHKEKHSREERDERDCVENQRALHQRQVAADTKEFHDLFSGTQLDEPGFFGSMPGPERRRATGLPVRTAGAACFCERAGTGALARAAGWTISSTGESSPR